MNHDFILIIIPFAVGIIAGALVAASCMERTTRKRLEDREDETWRAAGIYFRNRYRQGND